MDRKLSTPVYIIAFFMSLMIFVIGVYIGYLIDTSNLQGVSDDVSNLSDRLSSAQLILLMEGNESSCPLYEDQLDSIDAEIERVGYKLTFLEEKRNIYDDDLKRKYFVLEAESYLLSKKARQLCGDNSVLLIHFYSNKNCERCREQGTEILKARDSLRAEGVEVKLFSFDGELESPVAESLERQYNITSYPSVVVNEKTYSGFRSESELRGIIKAAR
ncbi:MAG TPA: hypothetical protein VLD37_07365 [Candidatus Bilamarchaeum sp.]|nr:hypothetical protein [Candidatus Bilamarchaeum sp.]